MAAQGQASSAATGNGSYLPSPLQPGRSQPSLSFQQSQSQSQSQSQAQTQRPQITNQRSTSSSASSSPILHRRGPSSTGLPLQPPPPLQLQRGASYTTSSSSSNASSPRANHSLAYATAQLSNYAASQSQHHMPPSPSQHRFAGHNAAAFYAAAGGQSASSASAASSISNPVTSPSTPSTAAAPFAPQMSQLPPGMLDFSALDIHSATSSAPPSAHSSPGRQHRRMPSASHLAMTNSNSSGSGPAPPPSMAMTHNSRVAASPITGKRLNWVEMICATLANSQHGRLVIQDLFEQMCQQFPEVHEWANGKEWEARVKNRIKSTLSIKGHLFMKVPRPSTASGKGSWWMLSQEALDAYHAGTLNALVKATAVAPVGGTHSRSGSRGDLTFTMSGNNSRYASPGAEEASQAQQHATGSTTDLAAYLQQQQQQHSPTQQQHMVASHNSPQQQQQLFGYNASNQSQPMSIQQGSSAFANQMHAQHAEHAAQLAQLQAHFLQQQQDQRDALPGSYDPNAPPSSGANLSSSFYNFDALGLNSGPDFPASMGSSAMSTSMGPPSRMPNRTSSSSGLQTEDSKEALMPAQMFGSSFGKGNAGIPVPRGGYSRNFTHTAPSGDESAMVQSPSNTDDAGLESMSFDPGSFGAVMRAFGAGGAASKQQQQQQQQQQQHMRNTASATGHGHGGSFDNKHLSGGGLADAFSFGDSPLESTSLSGSGSSTSPTTGFGTASSGSGGSSNDPRRGVPTWQNVGSPVANTHLGGGFQPQQGSENTRAANTRTPQSTSTGRFAPPPGPGGMYPFFHSPRQDNPNQTNMIGAGAGVADAGNKPFFNEGMGGFFPSPNAGQHPHPHPFGASLAGGYAIPGQSQSHHPQQQYGQAHGSHDRDGGRGELQRSMSSSSGNLGGDIIPSPADSTSAFFAYTPATMAVDASNDGFNGHRRPSISSSHIKEEGGGSSALGPMIGRRRGNTGAAGQNSHAQFHGHNGKNGAGRITRESLQSLEGDEGFALPPPV